jgi:hypothetical protein
MVKQKAQNRIERLKLGCCPVHGIYMSQIDSWYTDEKGKDYTIVGCPRRNCKIIAKAYSFDGPWSLPENLLALLDDSLPDPNYIDENTTFQKNKKSQTKYKKQLWEKTGGVCFYCGNKIALSETTVDHFFPESKGGMHDIENLVPSCKSCNSSKGTKTIEEFRFLMAMKLFKKDQGISFTQSQIEYLESRELNVDVPSYVFWFEDNNTE